MKGHSPTDDRHWLIAEARAHTVMFGLDDGSNCFLGQGWKQCCFGTILLNEMSNMARN